MKTHDATGKKDDAIAAEHHRRAVRRALLLIPLLALFVVHPLIVQGCSCGHDFDFHLLSWFEAATQISHGNLHPQWAYTAAWDAGEPRFVFYPPLSWYLGALLGIVLTHLPGLSEASAWTAAPVAFTWIALMLSGLTMYRWARRYADANAAVIAAAIYMANPYMLFTAYERTAYGELLAAAWIPLLLESILRERISVARIAIPIALLWLTNAPAAVMGCYALALLAIVRLAHNALLGHGRSGDSRSSDVGHAASTIAGGALLGLALAAFYIVPAAYERRYVQTAMATIGGMSIDANFLFRHTGSSPDELLHDQVLRTASWIAVALLVATSAALITAWMRNRSPTGGRQLPIAPLTMLTVVIAFLLTPLSVPIWHYAPEMAFLQFPWRLLALLTPILALAIAKIPPNLSNGASAAVLSTRAALPALLIAAVLTIPAWHVFRQPCDPDDTAAARLALFHSNAGTDPTDEYTPVTADNDASRPDVSAWWLADSADAASPADTSTLTTRTAPKHLTVSASRAEFLILNLRDYPAWRITLTRDSGAPQSVDERWPRNDGLTTIRIPAGSSVINIRYARTTDQTAGDAASFFAIAVMAGIAIRRRKPNAKVAI